jgi:hypothetical protein
LSHDNQDNKVITCLGPLRSANPGGHIALPVEDARSPLRAPVPSPGLHVSHQLGGQNA